MFRRLASVSAVRKVFPFAGLVRGLHTAGDETSTTTIDCVTTMGTMECLDELRIFLQALSSHESTVRPADRPLRVVVGATAPLIETLCTPNGGGGTVGGDSTISCHIGNHHTISRMPGLEIEWLPTLDQYTVGATVADLVAQRQVHHRLKQMRYKAMDEQRKAQQQEVRRISLQEETEPAKATSTPSILSSNIDALRRDSNPSGSEIDGEDEDTLVRPADIELEEILRMAEGPLGIDRQVMEQTPGLYFPTRHADFMMEKANLMEYALTTAHLAAGARLTQAGEVHHAGPPRPGNVLFLDCDIVSFAPLPKVKSSTLFGVCPHGIKSMDEALFGRYNGGWVYCNGAEPIFLWRQATHASRYFDQASLEDVARWLVQRYGRDDVVQEFPQQNNFGYWRLFQNEKAAEEVLRAFTIAPAPAFLPPADGSISPATGGAGGPTTEGSGPLIKRIHFNGIPLQSVHTHFAMPSSSKTMLIFNQLLVKWMEHCVGEGVVGGGAGTSTSSASIGGAGELLHPYSSVLSLLPESRRNGGEDGSTGTPSVD